MTRKHYEMIAEAIRQATKDSFFNLVTSDKKDEGKDFVLDTLANVILQVSLTLEDDNSNFDREKFADACMVSSS